MKINLILLFICLAQFSYGQSDSSAYETQRKKINNLLAQRSNRFGQYDASLIQRTGIFGLKTKKDMQRSIDILTDIVKTDNNILAETKTLLDYKDFEKTQVETKATESEGKIYNYMQAITNLQKQNDLLNEEKTEVEKVSRVKNYILFFMALIIAALAAFFLMQNKRELEN